MSPLRTPARRVSLATKILLAMLLGVLVGVAVNLADTRLFPDGVWARVGVLKPADFLASRDPAPPADMLGPDGTPLTDPASMSPEERRRFNPNADATPAARALRFLVNLNKFVGDLFIRSLRFIAVPIVLFSLVAGAASLGDLRKLGRIGGRTILVYTGTTAVAITVGLTLATLVRPGDYVPATERDALLAARAAEVAQRAAQTADVPTLWAQALNLIPANPFEALARGEMLQVIVFAMAVGIGLTALPEARRRPVVDLFQTLSDVITSLVHVVMRLAPLAVFCLLVPVVATLGLGVLRALAAYALVILAGLAIVMYLEYPLLLRLLAGMGFRRFFAGIGPAQLLAFSSSSSSATLPVTLDCARQRLGVSDRVASFVCPLGATINMDGTALYQGVATVFIAQLFSIDLTLTQRLTVVLTATLASIGTPGIPGAGVVMLVVVLETVSVPPAGIAVILGVDRVLDMCRTVVNVTGDAMTSVIVARAEGELRSDP